MSDERVWGHDLLRQGGSLGRIGDNGIRLGDGALLGQRHRSVVVIITSGDHAVGDLGHILADMADLEGPDI